MTHTKKKEKTFCEDCNSADADNTFEKENSFQSECIPEEDGSADFSKMNAEEGADSDACSENAALLKRVEELTSAYLTLAADFENYKKRTAKNIEDVKKFAAEPLMKDLTEVADNFERAIVSADNENTDKESLKEGIKKTYRQLMTFLESHGLSKVPSDPGSEFDPHLHESVVQIPTNQYPDETIVEVLKSGYILNGKVIRPATVTISVQESND